MKTQKFLSLDLELNNGPETVRPKIIQVGITIGAVDEPETDWITRAWFVDPQEPIFPFITELTGITDADIKHEAVSYQTVADELEALIKEHQPFINPVTWGGGDSSELLFEFSQRGITFKNFGRRWIDVKTYFVMQQLALGKTYAGGLKSTMERFRLKFQGHPHRADADAFNTLRLFAYFVNRHAEVTKFIESAKAL